jgi:hypothetical protein
MLYVWDWDGETREAQGKLILLLADKENDTFTDSGAAGFCLNGTEKWLKIDCIFSSIVHACLNADLMAFNPSLRGNNVPMTGGKYGY